MQEREDILELVTFIFQFMFMTIGVGFPGAHKRMNKDIAVSCRVYTMVGEYA